MPQCVIWQIYKEYYGSVLDKGGFIMLVSLLHPKSKGAISLHSTDPRDPPVIDTQFLSHPDDLQTLVKGECCAIHSCNWKKSLRILYFYVPWHLLYCMWQDGNAVCLLSGIQFALKLANTDALRSLGAKFHDKVSIITHCIIIKEKVNTWTFFSPSFSFYSFLYFFMLNSFLLPIFSYVIPTT